MRRRVLFCMAISCSATWAMNSPVLLPQISQECQSFCEQVHLNELQRDTERLKSSIRDGEFLPLIQKFATNIIRLNNVLSLLRQGEGNYSAMIRFRYGRELGAFLVGTRELFVRQDIKKRLVKLKKNDLVNQFIAIGVLPSK